MDLNKQLSLTIEEHKEIQRRYSEIVPNPKKSSEMVTDLVEPQCNDIEFFMTNDFSEGKILLRKWTYGESRSSIKKKYPKAESWSIFCNCRNRGEFGLPCQHIIDIAQANFNKLNNWNNLTEYYLNNIKATTKILNDAFSKLPEELQNKYIRSKTIMSEKQEDRDNFISELKKMGFDSKALLKEFILYYSFNYAFHNNPEILLEMDKISQYVKSPKFINFLKIKKTVNIVISQKIRFQRLSKKLNEFEMVRAETNNNEYEIMKQIGLDLWNFGEDTSRYLVE